MNKDDYVTNSQQVKRLPFDGQIGCNNSDSSFASVQENPVFQQTLDALIEDKYNFEMLLGPRCFSLGVQFLWRTMENDGEFALSWVSKYMNRETQANEFYGNAAKFSTKTGETILLRS